VSHQFYQEAYTSPMVWFSDRRGPDSKPQRAISSFPHSTSVGPTCPWQQNWGQKMFSTAIQSGDSICHIRLYI